MSDLEWLETNILNIQISIYISTINNNNNNSNKYTNKCIIEKSVSSHNMWKKKNINII